MWVEGINFSAHQRQRIYQFRMGQLPEPFAGGEIHAGIKMKKGFVRISLLYVKIQCLLANKDSTVKLLLAQVTFNFRVVNRVLQIFIHFPEIALRAY